MFPLGQSSFPTVDGSQPRANVHPPIPTGRNPNQTQVRNEHKEPMFQKIFLFPGDEGFPSPQLILAHKENPLSQYFKVFFRSLPICSRKLQIFRPSEPLSILLQI